MNCKLTRRNFIVAAGLASASAGLPRLFAAATGGSVAEQAEEAHRLITRQVEQREMAAAAFLVRQGRFEFARAYGRAKIDTPFLIASPTKPMTVSALMVLRDRGELMLSDPVRKYLPQFTGGDRGRVTIKHLLTHTSGLPDMLPDNLELRKQHAPLNEFVARTFRTPLLFVPGDKVSYQSMGILLAAAIVEVITQQRLPAFLASTIFEPLRLSRTSLGLGGRAISETPQCEVDEPSDWDWNSAYWRNLAAPWGGAHSTVHDLATFAEAFVAAEAVPWRAETRREMREIQTAGLRPSYGLGWAREKGHFGTACSAATFGHHGSTGTVVWHDPEAKLTCVILTTKPAVDSRARLIVPVSDIVSRTAPI